MRNRGCACRPGCLFRVRIVSTVIGIVAAFLRTRAVFTVPAAFLIGAFVLAAVYLATILVVSVLLRAQPNKDCLCPVVGGALAGILTTALTATVLLVIPFGATSIVGAIVTGLLAAGVSLILGATACLVRCLAGCAE